MPKENAEAPELAPVADIPTVCSVMDHEQCCSDLRYIGEYRNLLFIVSYHTGALRDTYDVSRHMANTVTLHPMTEGTRVPTGIRDAWMGCTLADNILSGKALQNISYMLIELMSKYSANHV